MSSRHITAALLLLAACGGGRAADPPPRPSVRDAAPLVVAPPAGDPLSEASLIADVEWLTAPERAGRGPESEATARWLIDELTAAGYAPTTQPIDGFPGQVNVIASQGAGATAVLVTAHHDHLGVLDGVIYPGADDNASGVAAALAVARDLGARRDVAGRVVFVFTGAEEPGLYGARAYVADPTVPLADTRVVLNLDMVGRRFFESAGGGAQAALGAVGLDPEDPMFAAASAAAEGAGLELLTVSPALVALVGEDWRSDDWVFRDAGVAAVHLSTGMHPDYHRPSDTVDHLDRAQLVRVARFLRDVVAALASE